MSWLQYRLDQLVGLFFYYILETLGWFASDFLRGLKSPYLFCHKPEPQNNPNVATLIYGQQKALPEAKVATTFADWLERIVGAIALNAFNGMV
jgi:hypothetical protein